MALVTKNDLKETIFMSVFAAEKSGKTRLGLTAEGPTKMFNFDREPDKSWGPFIDAGLEIDQERYVHFECTFADWAMNHNPATQKALSALIGGDPSNPKPEFFTELNRLHDKNDAQHKLFMRLKNDAILTQFFMELDKACDDPHFNTIFVDGGASLWNIILFSKFGKGGEILPEMYGKPRSVMQRITERLEKSHKDCIITLEEKPEYRDNKATGNMVNAGDSKMAYRTKAHIRLWKDDQYSPPDCFNAVVVQCSENINVWGKPISGSKISFPLLKEFILHG